MKKILLIDDNREIRENTAEILELANYKVFTADNGKSGVEKALEHKPDLIICDIMMPVLDGYGVLHLLNQHPELHHTAFIFLSAKTEVGEIRKGMSLGADDYITKPFEGTELLNAVEIRLRKADLIRKDIMGGITGVQQLLSIQQGKDILHAFTEDRNVNHYKKKQIIYSEGNHPSRLFFISKGKVKTFKVNEEGKELVVGLYATGEFLGHVALLEHAAYNETAEAIEDCEIAVIPREDFETLVNSNNEVSSLFIKMLAHDVAQKETQLLGLAYNSLRRKVADALISLQKKFQPNGESEFSMEITRENLATIAGTATESLIRTLSDFKAEKMINIHDGVITITDLKKLINLAN